MKKLILLIEYDGTNYCGWQRQENANSIQSELERAIFKLTGQHIGVNGAGRTDTGVHAAGQVAHCLPEKDVQIPESKIAKALNFHLPPDIRIKQAVLREGSFHARFSASGREYAYRIITRDSVFKRRFFAYIKYPLDSLLLFSSGDIFTGRHDFTAFSKNNSDTGSYVCNVEFCRWEETGPESFTMRIKADRFVYGMVRAIAGGAIDIARGKRTHGEVIEALASCDRSKASPLAPPEGLTLERIYYPDEYNYFK